MITDGIMQVIYDMQESIKEEVAELNQRFNDKEIYTGEYTTEMDALEAKLEVLSEMENKFGKYIEE